MSNTNIKTNSDLISGNEYSFNTIENTFTIRNKGILEFTPNFTNIIKIKFTQKNSIKNILFYSNYDYNVALSISSNLNMKMIEDSIFKDNWQINLLTLTDQLIKNK
jgi:hypothetical protein